MNNKKKILLRNVKNSVSKKFLLKNKVVMIDEVYLS